MSNPVGSSPNRSLLVDETSTRASTRAQEEIAENPQATGSQRATSKAAALAVDHVSSDARPSESTLRDRIADLGATPTLPGNSSSVRAEVPSSAALSDFMARTGDGTGALMWQALAEMAKNSSDDAKDASDARNAFAQGKVDAKKGQINHQEAENAASRDDAGMQLGFSTAGAAIAMVASRDSDTTTGQAKPMSLTLAQVAPSLATAAGQFISKTAGPQARANKAKVAGMRDQMMEQMADQAVENAKSSYDSAREQMKLAVKILTEHSERQTQISTTITRA